MPSHPGTDTRRSAFGGAGTVPTRRGFLRGAAKLGAVVSATILTGACTRGKERSQERGPVSVGEFGAVGDGITDDGPALQRALDAGGPLSIPRGNYLTGRALVLHKDGTQLIGEGPESALRLAPGLTGPGIVMPAPRDAYNNPPAADKVVRDVVLSNFLIDANHNGHPVNNDQKDLCWCIQAYGVEGLEISWMTLLNASGEGLIVGTGWRLSKNVRVVNSHVRGCGRNGLAFTHVSGGLISKCYIEDSPAQTWAAPSGAGNGIDLEVEGLDPVVEDFEISDCLIVKRQAATAGFGIQATKAFGPVRRGRIIRNVIRNYQAGIAAFNAEDTAIEDNFITTDAAVNTATGMGLILATTDTAVEQTARRNTLHLVSGAAFAETCVWMQGPGVKRLTGNKFYGGTGSTLRLVGDSPLTLVAEDNEWGGPPVFVNEEEPGIHRREEARNTMTTPPPLAVPVWDMTQVPVSAQS